MLDLLELRQERIHASAVRTLNLLRGRSLSRHGEEFSPGALRKGLADLERLCGVLGVRLGASDNQGVADSERELI